MNRILMRYPEGRAKALTLSYDDGVEQDIELIAKMKKHGIKGTFNYNTGEFAAEGTIYEKGRIHRRMTAEAVRQLITESGMEAASHSLTHPFLTDIPVEAVLWEEISDRNNLEKLFGIPIHGMAYPYGAYNDRVVEQLKNAGIRYARTVISTNAFRQPKDWLRLETTCHHKNPELMGLAEKFIAETPKTEAFLFYLWGHSYEFETDNNWTVMDDFFTLVGNHKDIWYATNIEIYNYSKAFERLDFSLDCSSVTNPASQEICFLYNDVMKSVKSGETIIL